MLSQKLQSCPHLYTNVLPPLITIGYHFIKNSSFSKNSKIDFTYNTCSIRMKYVSFWNDNNSSLFYHLIIFNGTQQKQKILHYCKTMILTHQQISIAPSIFTKIICKIWKWRVYVYVQAKLKFIQHNFIQQVLITLWSYYLLTTSWQSRWVEWSCF